MHLDADLASERNGGILLDVVDRLDTVDPRPDRRALRANLVVVPVAFLDRGG